MTEASLPIGPTKGAFRPGVMLALVLAAVLSMLAMAVMSAWAPELSDGNDGRDHALSKSATGYAGVVSLLRGLKHPVVLSRGALRGAGPDSLLILTPPSGRDEKQMNVLIRHKGAVLVVLPKWRTAPDPRRRGWVRTLGLASSEEALSVLPSRLRGDARLGTLTGERRVRLLGESGQAASLAGPVTSLRSLTGRGWTPVLTDQDGRAVLLIHDRTGLYVLTDADLLNTLALNDPAKARGVLAIIATMATPEQPVVFDLSLNGFSRPRSLMRLLLEPPLLGFTLCLLAAVLLIGWQAMIRFEPHLRARRAVALGKTALADNTAALARLARREHRMARPYAELVRTRAARAVSAPSGLSADALTALLDRLAARHGGADRWDHLLAQADAARTPADLMAVTLALNRWKSEMTRGRS